MAAGKEDLRIQKTKEAIRSAFERMICEMNYEHITIKELTERARINRKTFYRHYQTLDDLLRELQKEIAQDFIRRTSALSDPHDLRQITKEFFDSAERLGGLGERIACSGDYRYISRRIMNDILSQTWGAPDAARGADPYIQNILMAFVTHSTLEIYKQWVADGKRVPREQLIELTSQLVCHGMERVDANAAGI